ncbi:MAG TPA: hypothetical protein VLG71_02090 [Candidatus Limnocylindria bacterium]|nr:hypothetical protein [Candidatus Limnocylindria bacterium]
MLKLVQYFLIVCLVVAPAVVVAASKVNPVALCGEHGCTGDHGDRDKK